MQKRLYLLLWIALCFFTCQLTAWEARDYSYPGLIDTDDCDDDGDDCEYIYFNSSELCLDCFFGLDEYTLYPFFTNRNHHGIDFDAIPPVDPRECKHCTFCDSKTIYTGYLHFTYRKDFPFLKKQILI